MIETLIVASAVGFMATVIAWYFEAKAQARERRHHICQKAKSTPDTYEDGWY